jgi:exonuclease SbcC
MRILQIRFKNLNSMFGEWEIDLTHPAYGDDGIFAITGPTGAGKSTILDALCLALYGRTPRLDSVNKTANELMSRQTGECLAEVTFETGSGRFRCHWAQHRARNRATGVLQHQRHEIVDVSNGVVLEHRIRDVAARVEVVIGMTFPQFTRSILLAQGGFAAFLQAGSDERAPVLEQITGTEIYSLISKAVHERRSDEVRTLETLEAALAGLDLLAPEAEAGLHAALAVLAERDVDLAAQIARRRSAIAWHEGIVALEKELEELALRRDRWQVRRAAFEPERKRLEAATLALELAADHRELAALRLAQASDLDALGQAREVLLVLTAAHAEGAAAERSRQAELVARTQEQQAAQPLLRQARELDLQLAKLDGPIEDRRAALAEGEADREKLVRRQDEDTKALEEARGTLAALEVRLEQTRADEGLVEHLAGLRERIDALQGHVARRAVLAGELASADEELAAATAHWQGQVAALGELEGVLQSCTGRLAGQKLLVEARLEGRTPADWRRLCAALVEGEGHLEQALETIRSLTAGRHLERELATRMEASSSGARALAASLEDLQRRQEALDRELELVETQMTLLRKIGALEEQRGGLRDQEPCPLCGALEHPYARGNVPAQDETLQRLSALRAERRSLARAISEGGVGLARLEKDLEQAAADRLACAGRIEEAGGRLCALGRTLSFEWKLTDKVAAEPELAALGAKLDGRLAQERTARERATGVLEAAEQAERETAGLQGSLERAREAHAVAGRETLTALHRQDTARQEVERRRQELDQTIVRCREALARLCGELAAYGVEAPDFEALPGVLDDLTARRDRRRAARRDQASCETGLAALEARTRQQAEGLVARAGDLERTRSQLAVLVLERQELARRRAEVFGQRLPDEEAQRLSSAMEDARSSQEAARRSLDGARASLDTHRQRLDELSGAIALRHPRLLTSEAGFAARLLAAGFSDEAAYGTACLDEADRRRLAERSRELSDEAAALAAQEGEKISRLAAQRERDLSREPLEALAASMELLIADQKALQQEIGGAQGKLRDNEDLKTTQLARAQARDAQRREYERWDRLHGLIGSSDGKKFRNFAQGLTFELMVGHANDQLRKMSDRYRLVRDPEKPLELNVVDNWQAGEIRSTKNLSGGECFQVSLALALGLSRMASLFLDEGFGTLDEEALESALSALAGLRQDGKLIGVISHVEALKERIGVQIRVTPISGGRSGLSGPGCREIAGKDP